MQNGRLSVPDRPIVPFIEGDGTGPDIWRASKKFLMRLLRRLMAASGRLLGRKCSPGRRRSTRSGNWLPDETLDAFREFRVGIKGPLTTPVGGGIRSLNVALRQILDLFVCLRPVRYFQGVPTPVKQPELVDMVIFRENTEDTYAGIEFAGGTPESQKVLDFLAREFPKLADKVRFGTQEKVDGWQKQLESIGAPHRDLKVDVGIGFKPMSYLGTERLVHSAIGYAVQNKRKSVTLVHKGNIMKFTEGGFRDWGYKVAREFYGAEEIDGGPWCKIPDGKPGGGLVIKDVIADAFLQQILTRPAEYDVIATPNLNGDYISDALAACVGGIGIAPGANINYVTGHAIFEATHGTAPKYAGQDKVNPGSVILSGEMMLRHMKWNEAADLDRQGHGRRDHGEDCHVRFRADDAGGHEVKCSEFGDAVVKHMS